MDDLISRQELLKRTIYNPLHVLYISSQDVLDCPSAQQWIPCSERLPEKFGDYLVSVKRHGWNCEEYIENDIAYWDDLEGFHKAEEVLAWMPLPEPYKGEEK